MSNTPKSAPKTKKLSERQIRLRHALVSELGGQTFRDFYEGPFVDMISGEYKTGTPESDRVNAACLKFLDALAVRLHSVATR